ncbi:uncharacterized protein LOC122267971 [Penaeus japonicus]|uniref:uncharacterized protein LOC122267971 n=1 Tax=Penaeus japonicus TaxID=27405 RepID=UPI001C70D79C|nr:uncharacterized protein LOC122267971 [Penaeus japonicus]
MAVNTDYLKSVPGILKLVELIFVVTAFGILRGGGAFLNETSDADFFVCGVLVTGLIVTPLLLVCYLMGRTEIQQSILELSLNLLLFVFLFSAGVVGAAFWDKRISFSKSTKQKSVALTSFCFLASFAYLADSVFAFRKFRSG